MVCLFQHPVNYPESKFFSDGRHVLHISFDCHRVSIRCDSFFFFLPPGPIDESFLFWSLDNRCAQKILHISSLVCDHCHIGPAIVFSKSELSSIFVGFRTRIPPFPWSVDPLAFIRTLPRLIRVIASLILWPPDFTHRCPRRIMTRRSLAIPLFYFRQCLSSFGISFTVFSFVLLSFGIPFPFPRSFPTALSLLYVGGGSGVGGFALTGATLAVSTSNLTFFPPR